jgi:MFS family permease
VTTATPVTGPPSAWAPLRQGAYRALWLAVLASQAGTWMQTVGAQWLLVGEPNAATLVALVQTMSTLPVLLLALPAGVLADSFDRRRLLIAVQCFQVIVAAALAALTWAGEMSPPLLLTLTFALGCGTAMTVPTYQAVIPELVPRAQLPSASALGAISMNLARAIGPAIAGLLVAQLGAEAVFAFNAVTFLVFAATLVAWRRPADADGEPAEPFIAALRAGGRYVRHSPVMRRFLLRLSLFVVPGVALWALLPLVATSRLHLGASGYGLLLGALGAGAIAGALLMPRLRVWLTHNQLLGVASGVYAVAVALTALVPVFPVVMVVLVPAGAAWVAVLANANTDVTMFLPRWVRARGLGTYQVVFFGGQAIGAFVWGVVADLAGLVPALVAAAALSAIAATTVKLWPLPGTAHLDREDAAYWREPQLATEPDPGAGPVVVEVTYTVPEENRAAFLDAMTLVRRSRMRTGAIRWGIFEDGERPGRMVEVYVVPTWEEHLRQHTGRLTGTDQETERRAHALVDGEPGVVHLLPPAR